VDKAPVPLDRPAPVYPAAARQMRRQGEVESALLIDAQGLCGGRRAAERRPRGTSARPPSARATVEVPARHEGRRAVQVKIVEKVSFKL
jgi:outer membrane biosynthesis protein TonB